MPSGPISQVVAMFALPRSLRSSLARNLATLALLPLCAGSIHAATPTFTVAGNIFPTTPLGQSTTQNVTVTVNAAVAIQSIALQPGFTEYKLGAVTGCTVDGKTVNAAGAVCTIPVTFAPKALGSTASPATARTAPLLVTDIESGSPVTYPFGLLGASTGPIVQFTPATLTRVAGAAVTGYPTADQGLGPTTAGYGGDSGPATSATFSFSAPTQPMAVDSAGNIFVIDGGNYIIRRIDGVTNTVTTVAGTPKKFGMTGNGGPATSAGLGSPASLAIDAADNIYFTDNGTSSNEGSFNLRMVNAGTGIISAIAGQNLTLPYSGSGTCVESGQSYTWEPTCGDGGLAGDAFLYNPQAVAIDAAGNIYILEEQGTIRKITASTGIITTVGNAIPSKTGQAYGMALGADGNLYAAIDDAVNPGDYLTQTDPATGVTKVVGGGASNFSITTCSEQGSTATQWFLDFGDASSPGLSADGAGNIYGQTGGCSGGLFSTPEFAYVGSFRFNIATGLAYAYTFRSSEGGNGTNNGVYDSFGGSYNIDAAFGVANGAGNIYFQTFNQIAELGGSQGALNGFGSRYDYQTDAAGTVCEQYAGSFCETAVIANVGNAPLNATYALSSGFTFLTIDDPAACVSGSLEPGEYCNLDIEFTPITTGTVNGTVTVTDNADLQGSGQQTLALAGTGVAAPLISFAPATIAFGNQAINTTSASQTVTISNSGTGPNSLDGIYIASSTFGVFTVAGGTCPTSGTLAAGASCTVLIAFAPTATGSFSGTLTVNNLVGSGVLSATTVTGTGTTGGAAQAVLSPTTLAFPNTTVGATAAAIPTTLSNPGTATLTGIAVAIAGANPSDFSQSNTCGATLAAGASCTISVTFAPASATSFAATLAVADSATGSPQTASLTGTGIAVKTAATPSIAPGTGAYTTNQTVTITDATAGATIYYSTDGSTPSVSSSKYAAPFTVSRTGTVVQAIAVAAGFANSAVARATYTLNAITPTLTPPGGAYNSPQSVALATATAGASIYYTTNGIAPTTESTLYTGPIAVTVSGTQIQAIAALSGYNNSSIASGTYTITLPTASLTPAILNFGNQAEGSASTAQILTLKNTGSSSLTGIVVSLSESSNDDVAHRIRPHVVTASTDYGATTTCGSTLAAGAACTISVDFDPQSIGSLPGSVTVSDNASNTPQTASLTGAGISAVPTATLSPSSLSFGNQMEGTLSAAQTLTLTNNGPGSLTGIAVSISEPSQGDVAHQVRLHNVTANSNDYGISTNCGATLASGATCTIAVTFAPTSLGSLPGTVSVTDDASNSPQTSTLSGTGTEPAAPVATLTPATLIFTSTTGTASAAQKATLSNTGNAALSITGITLAGANPSDFSQTNTCGSSLSAGATCTISVVFMPASAASFAATLSVADNAAGSPQTSSLSGTGSAPAGDFAISATPAAQTIAAGSTATYNVAVATTPSGATFSSAVTLTASGLPPGATASFSPASVTPGSGSVSSTLTVQTAAAATAANKPSVWPTALAAPSMAFLAGGIMLLFRRRKFTRTLRKLYPILILAGLGLASLAVMGCNGGFALPKPTPTANTYTVTITGAAGDDTHSTTVTLTVN